MELKKYTASNMAEAMIRIKNDLGDDAVILQTRRVRRGGFLGIGSKIFVEVTAMSEEKKEPVNSSVAVAQVPDQNSSIGSELSEIKKTLKVVNDRLSNVKTLGHLPEPFEKIRLRLLDAGLKTSEADAVVQTVSENLTKNDAENPDKLSLSLKEYFEDLVNVKKVAFTVPQRIVLLGPTGVGKTTTIAKLAANLTMREKLPVMLLTLDTYRIAAAQQLKTYADILHIPFKVVYTPQEAAEVVNSINDRVVIVDTAGRSQKDELKISEIAAYVQSIKPDMVFLAIDATKKRTDVEDIIERFSPTGPTNTILTKLDETTSVLGSFMALGSSKLPLSFVTNGQNVPENILYADDLKIPSLIVEEVLKNDA